MIYFLRCLITFDSKPDFSERCFCEGNLCMVGCGCIHMEYLLCDPIILVISGSFLSFSLSTFLSSSLSLSFFISNTCGCPTPVWLKRRKNFYVAFLCNWTGGGWGWASCVSSACHLDWETRVATPADTGISLLSYFCLSWEEAFIQEECHPPSSRLLCLNLGISSQGLRQGASEQCQPMSDFKMFYARYAEPLVLDSLGHLPSLLPQSHFFSSCIAPSFVNWETDFVFSCC